MPKPDTFKTRLKGGYTNRCASCTHRAAYIYMGSHYCLLYERFVIKKPASSTCADHKPNRRNE